MGKIKITEQQNEWEIDSSRWEGVIDFRMGDENTVEIVVSSDSPYSPEDIQVRKEDHDRDPGIFGEGPAYLLYIPTLLALVAVGLDQLSLLEGLVSSEVTSIVVLGAYWLFGLSALFGTLHIYEDAEQRRESGADWTPNPWVYIVSGAVVVTVLNTLLMGFPTVDTATMIGYVAGALILGSIISSAVSGPVYLLKKVKASNETLRL